MFLPGFGLRRQSESFALVGWGACVQGNLSLLLKSLLLKSLFSSEDGGPESALSRHLLAGFDSPFPLPWESVPAVPEHKAEWFLLGPRPVPQDC